MKWREWIKEHLHIEIPFPVIADYGAVIMRVGMIHLNKGSSTVRAVFIMDTEGTIRIVLYYPQEIGRSMDEFHGIVKIFQIADKEKVAIPAN